MSKRVGPTLTYDAGMVSAKGGVEIPDKSSVAGELRLIGKTTDEARDLLEEYLDDAFMAGLPSVRIIHGKGTGAVRRAVEDVLSTHPLVITHRPGSASEGGGGATVAALGPQPLKGVAAPVLSVNRKRGDIVLAIAGEVEVRQARDVAGAENHKTCHRLSRSSLGYVVCVSRTRSVNS